MSASIDTIGFFKANPGATLVAATASPGDSFGVRAFADTATAKLERVTYQGATAGGIGITSPMLHDDTRGIQFTAAAGLSSMLMPQETGQPLVRSDTLGVDIAGGTAETDVGTLSIYYSDLGSGSAKLFSWADISALVKNIKPLAVDVTNSATPGDWTDTVITTTENLIHAGKDYAVLGYVTNVAQCAVGVKSTETGNLRVCGPGQTLSDITSDFFVTWSDREGTPHIPVFNADNRAAVNVSTLDATASSTPVVQLVLAELSSRVTG